MLLSNTSTKIRFALTVYSRFKINQLPESINIELKVNEDWVNTEG